MEHFNREVDTLACFVNAPTSEGCDQHVIQARTSNLAM